MMSVTSSVTSRPAEAFTSVPEGDEASQQQRRLSAGSAVMRLRVSMKHVYI